MHEVLNFLLTIQIIEAFNFFINNLLTTINVQPVQYEKFQT